MAYSWPILISKWAWSKSKHEPLLLLVRFRCRHLSKHMKSIHFKWMQLIICKLYFDKVDLGKKKTCSVGLRVCRDWGLSWVKLVPEVSSPLGWYPLDWAMVTVLVCVPVPLCTCQHAGPLKNKLVHLIFVITQCRAYSFVHWLSIKGGFAYQRTFGNVWRPLWLWPGAGGRWREGALGI